MNIRRISMAVCIAIIAGFYFPVIVQATEDFKVFLAGLAAGSTPLGSGDRCLVLQGGADKYVPCNIFVTTAGPNTLTNATINGSSNTLTVLAGSQLSGTTPVANGGTGLTAGVSGGVLCATGSTTYAFSGALTANAPLIGGGAGACPGLGSFSGNTTKSVSTTGTLPVGQGGSWDANGNWVSNANAVFTNVAQSFTAQQTFASTLGTQNNQTTPGVNYTLLASDCGKMVYFTSASAATVTLPPSLPVPCTVQIEQGGTGQITVIPATGASGPSNPRGFSKTLGQFAVITVFVDTNSGANGHWILTGDGA